MEIHHFCHVHPLTLREKHKQEQEQELDEQDLVLPDWCCGCELPIYDDSPSYGCNQCEQFLIHKSCIDGLTQEIIHHPFHPHHPLTLVYNDSINNFQSFVCSACKGPCYSFAFHCYTCDFILHIGCTSLIPTISYEGHAHLLTLFDEIHSDSFCNSCNFPCWKSNTFRCVECDFNLHIRCAPSLLPPIINHECHTHPLTLRHSAAHENDRWRENFCDACDENIRNPNRFYYYCEECEFLAELGCVVSAVLAPLITEQERNMKTEKTEAQRNKVVAIDISVAKPNEVAADPILAKLDAEIAKYHTTVEDLTEVLEDVKSKLEKLKVERVEYASTKETELKEVVLDSSYDIDQAEGKKMKKEKKVLDKQAVDANLL